MLRARMDVERIAKLVEAQGGFRTFADEMPKDGDPISVVLNVPRFSSNSAGSSRVITVIGQFFMQNANMMMVITGYGLGVQVFPQDYWTPSVQ
ncbi:MAG: hypothetical protein [Bacteriophage sp.]|nr:MAG: hypothetical protein [Bacteriophage sp.]